MMVNILKKICLRIIVYISPLLSDKMFLKARWYVQKGYKLNLSNPISFNEKLQWLKLYDRKDIYSKMVDKYEAKNYVRDRITDIDIIIPTIGIYNRVEDIDFQALPNQFVMKCTHDSGGIIICKDKNSFDENLAKSKMQKYLKRSIYNITREWPYKNVRARIIIEKYMQDDNGELMDYKFFCFNGEVICLKVDFDRFSNHRANYYDKNFNLLSLDEKRCPSDSSKIIETPKNYNLMIKIAEDLSKDHPFLRVDLYNINGTIYFGEMTFFPDSGFGTFSPEEWDYKLGSYIKLPQ